jgi:hypothetical protein
MTRSFIIERPMTVGRNIHDISVTGKEEKMTNKTTFTPFIWKCGIFPASCVEVAALKETGR